jgi:hypothetical protein
MALQVVGGAPALPDPLLATPLSCSVCCAYSHGHSSPTLFMRTTDHASRTKYQTTTAAGDVCLLSR